MEIKQERDRQAYSHQMDQLILDVAGGNRFSFSQLYDRTRTAVYSFVLSYLRNCQDAEDITQDVFVQIWNAAGSYRSQGSAMAWILTIAKNMALAHLRRQNREIPVSAEELEAIPNRPSTAEDRVLLSFLLRELTPEEHKIVVLHAVAGLKHREIADLMELPLATVLSKYHRSLKKMKAKMGGEIAHD